MTVENDDSQAVNIRQGFVPFQALVNVVNPLPQPVGIEHRMDSSQGVCAEGRLFEPTLPKVGLPNLFPSIDQAQLPLLALNQLQRLMQFPTSTTAIRLATSARTFRESATKKPLTGGKLRNAGTEVALDGGELGAAVQRGAHNLYIVYIQDTKKSQEQKHNANLLSERTPAKA